MTSQLLIQLSPAELQAMLSAAVTPLSDRIRDLETQVSISKHAYTVKEVALKTGYSADSVRDFIRKGKLGKSGKLVRLPVHEITAGDYRILPADLDQFIKQF